MSTAPHIRIGDMRSFVDLQRKAETPDAGGGVDVVWETERELYCRIRALSGTQRLEGMRRQSSATHEIYTNWAPDVDPSIVTTKRIRDEAGATYNILAAWMPENVTEFVHMIAERGMVEPGVAT
jgi:head-tail adaptor